MASVQEKLAESLSVLKDYQDSHGNMIIKGYSALGETHTKRLFAGATTEAEHRHRSLYRLDHRRQEIRYEHWWYADCYAT